MEQLLKLEIKLMPLYPFKVEPLTIRIKTVSIKSSP